MRKGFLGSWLLRIPCVCFYRSANQVTQCAARPNGAACWACWWTNHPLSAGVGAPIPWSTNSMARVILTAQTMPSSETGRCQTLTYIDQTQRKSSKKREQPKRTHEGIRMDKGQRSNRFVSGRVQGFCLNQLHVSPKWLINNMNVKCVGAATDCD